MMSIMVCLLFFSIFWTSCLVKAYIFGECALFVRPAPPSPFSLLTQSNKVDLLDIPYPSFQSSNLPFYPRTMREIAQDCSYSVKVGIGRNLGRMLVDIDHDRLNDVPTAKLYFLMFLIMELHDEELTRIHVYMDRAFDKKRIAQVFQHVGASYRQKIKSNPDYKLKISTLDGGDEIEQRDSLVILFEPNNYFLEDKSDYLIEIQTLIFRATYLNIPILMISPSLTSAYMVHPFATAPYFIRDFKPIYFLIDNHIPLPLEKRIAIISRSGMPLEAYLIIPGEDSYVRIKSYADGVQEDLMYIVGQILCASKEFEENLEVLKRSQQWDRSRLYYDSDEENEEEENEGLVLKKQ